MDLVPGASVSGESSVTFAYESLRVAVDTSLIGLWKEGFYDPALNKKTDSVPLACKPDHDGCVASLTSSL